MPDQGGDKDPGAIWRGQPEEKTAVNLEQIVDRKTEELYFSTRSEILMSIAAALLLVVVMAWRFAEAYDRFLAAGFAATVVWVGVTLYRFRGRIWRREPAPPDAAAATGLEYYRRELERRRDHLRDGWLWHGPLLLACLVFLASLYGKAFPGVDRLPGVLPLVALLAAWTAFGILHRRRQARGIQREIDEMDGPGTRV
jgi:hypothetical protein